MKRITWMALMVASWLVKLFSWKSTTPELTMEASPTCVSLLEMVKSATRDTMKSRELVKSAAVVALEASTRKMTSA